MSDVAVPIEQDPPRKVSLLNRRVSLGTAKPTAQRPEAEDRVVRGNSANSSPPRDSDFPAVTTGESVAANNGSLSQRNILGATLTDDEDGEEEGEEDDDFSDDDGDDDEPRLNYARLTPNFAGVYRNGDSTSVFIAAGQKMIIGTHAGFTHVVLAPTFQPVRVYRAHSASVTAISISPFPSSSMKIPLEFSPSLPASPKSTSLPLETTPTSAPRRQREPLQQTSSSPNNLYVATSSLDGHVCVQSLTDPDDVQLRNFARPVQAVALSPSYKSDRTYLSGGLAGNLILTVGGSSGRSVSTTIGTAAATASGWLGSIGIGSNAGKDAVLHTGEGTISTIKWSLSGKFVVWLNEHGIKIMRTKLHLDANHLEDGWSRIGHVDRPQSDDWDTMASVWKGRVEWIDEQSIETDDSIGGRQASVSSVSNNTIRQQAAVIKSKAERLLVGWGGTLWIIHVHPTPGRTGQVGDKSSPGRAEIIKILRMDCIIAGLSLYTQNLLLILAYCLPEPQVETETKARRTGARVPTSKRLSASTDRELPGETRRHENCQLPELRLIDLTSSAEIARDGLSVSRYGRLSSADYHLGLIGAQVAVPLTMQRGAFDALAGFGTDVLNVAINPRSLFSSNTSITSRNSGDDRTSATKSGSVIGGASKNGAKGNFAVHPNLTKPGLKIFIHSPHDCILATKRDLADHLNWLLDHQKYQSAWELLDDNPEILPDMPGKAEKPSTTLGAGLAKKADSSFAADVSSSAASINKSLSSTAQIKKRKIGEMWIQELVDAGNWSKAGSTCAKVLNTPDGWEKWGLTFTEAKKFDEIADYLPTKPMRPPVPKTLYETVLGHYVETDKPRFRKLLGRWPAELFDVQSVVTALENQLRFREVREDSIEDGERGRDWRIVLESLARLYEAGGRQRDAFKYFVKLQDAGSAFRIIRENNLAGALADDIPGFIGLQVPPHRFGHMTAGELEEATAEAISLLVHEARHGLVPPKAVVSQLIASKLNLYTFFYLRQLWTGEGLGEHLTGNQQRFIIESRGLVDDFADVTVHLFAMYDRPLLMEFLKTSTSYTFDKAVQECEAYNYDDELVYLYSKTGQMKKALFLIIDRLHDVPKAISFAKEQNDPDLWDDLLTYSMDKPRFIRGLFENVGTAINPITLVRRIPDGLEVEGLREGIHHIIKEHELQHSIGYGAARVLRSEVAAAQAELRRGRRRGVKFEVLADSDESSPAAAGTAQPSGTQPSGTQPSIPSDPAAPVPAARSSRALRGLCAACAARFTTDEDQILVGFACGHVFHLPHLFDLLASSNAADRKRRKTEEELVRMPGAPGPRNGRGHAIGTKVTLARLLKDHLRGGCPICRGLASPVPMLSLQSGSPNVT